MTEDNKEILSYTHFDGRMVSLFSYSTYDYIEDDYESKVIDYFDYYITINDNNSIVDKVIRRFPISDYVGDDIIELAYNDAIAAYHATIDTLSFTDWSL